MSQKAIAVHRDLVVSGLFSLVVLCFSLPTLAHVVLADPAAPAGSSYRATFRVGHGCDGSPVTAIRVTLPAGFKGAKPMPKPGWVLNVKVGDLAIPYESHGKLIANDVREVTWTAASKDYWLADAWYDEFVLRGNLPDTLGALWFAVLQTCDKGSIDWSEQPASGTSTKGLKAPAALLKIVEPASSGHSH